MANSDVTAAQDADSHLLIRRTRRALPNRVREFLGHRYSWVAPTFLLLFSLTVFPLLFLLYLSVHDWSLFLAARRGFVGLENYVTVIKEGAFLHSLWVTSVFTVVAVGTELVFGTAIALFVYHRLPDRWRSMFQTAFLLPMMMSYIAVGLLWRYLWNGSIGLVNYFFGLVGLPAQGWLGDPTMAIFTVIVADIWQWTPFVILVVLAGLEGLPEAPFEAARMDGASTFEMFRYVTLPLLKPIFVVILLFRTADAFRIFDKVYIMTSGGPGDASMTLSMLIYRRSFKSGNFGEAAVISVFMLVVISAVAFVIIRRARDMGAI